MTLQTVKSFDFLLIYTKILFAKVNYWAVSSIEYSLLKSYA